MPGMRVERLEVQLAGNQEDDGLDGGQAFEAASSALGGLEQAIDGFKEAVGLTGLRPGDDAVHVAAHEGCDFLHRLDLGSHHADAPVLEPLAHHVDLLSVKRLAQLLLVEPRAGRPCELGCRDQPVQCCAGRRFEAEDILEQRPAHALEGLLGALLDAPGFVHGRVRMSDNVELVEGDLRVGQLVAYALDERGRTMSMLYQRVDLFGRAAMSCQIGSQRLHGFGVPPLIHEDHASRLGVGSQGHIVVAASARRLVDGQRRDVAEVGLLQGHLDIAVAHLHAPVRRLAHDARNGRERHLLRQHQHQRLEQQREARQPPSEVRLDQANRSVTKLHTRRANLQVALVLEKVQVPVGLDHGVMNRMQPLLARYLEPRARLEVHRHRQHLGRFVELDRAYRPRRADPQRRFKHLGRHPNPRVSGKPPEILPTQIFREPVFVCPWGAVPTTGVRAPARYQCAHAPWVPAGPACVADRVIRVPGSCVGVAVPCACA
ncbi:unknown protein [Xanthomonas oryzae pv. oryzae KACC 10331]|uniref:Uncharacterized protein n=1 Tax=Xanthomonas oryzae pv. oryzae (strain KACC10331 / KXO85) TaxID=291331 RepID=Q5H484_XANOR|nr:unknown protein [Xanthomonas oryzae pv. oryzae KACC 10331]